MPQQREMLNFPGTVFPFNGSLEARVLSLDCYPWWEDINSQVRHSPDGSHCNKYFTVIISFNPHYNDMN